MSASAIPPAVRSPDPIPGEPEHLKVTKASQATQSGSQSGACVPGLLAKWPSLLESLSQPYPPSTHHLFITLPQGGWG